MPGLYIHIPFCVKKCKYCDFVSFQNRDEFKDRYINCLIKEAAEYKGENIDTVFIGGGTPTTLSCVQLEKLLSALRENFNIDKNAEFTCEMNPGTADKDKLRVLKRCGVNRLSMGVQSFCDDELKKIGRIHTAAQADGAIRDARECGFENISIDLMSALPSQTFESFKKTLLHAVEKNPEHISCYSLILEENTPLYAEYEAGKLILPSEDDERDMYEFACNFLEKNGYAQYEISNFAKEGKCSRHNMKYWQCREYIGLGIAAHSYYKGVRYYNTSDLPVYLSRNFHSDGKITLTLEDKIEEFMIMGLRMTAGISRTEFKRRFNISVDDVFREEIKKFVSGGFLCDDGENIRLSRKGISVSNSVMCEFAVCNIKKNI